MKYYFTVLLIFSMIWVAAASAVSLDSYNLADPESKKTLFRTVIILDPEWSDDFDVYQCQLGYPDNLLRKI